MGIQNRDYYRRSNSSGTLADWGLYSLTPVVKYLIIVNVAVFILQYFLVRDVQLSPIDILRKQYPDLDKRLNEAGDDPAAIEEVKKDYPELEGAQKQLRRNPRLFMERASRVHDWFALDTNKVVRQGQVWRLLTHAFCHDRLDILHIAFNMLFLYWWGCTLESMYGSREFLFFYLTAAVVAALAQVGLDLWTGSSIPGVGASGAVLAVTMLYALHFPRETICIFWFLPIEMRWLMIAYLIFDLHPVLLAISGDNYFTGIAHAAHLGGLVFGFLYGWQQWRLSAALDWLPAARQRPRPRPVLRLREPPLRVVPADDLPPDPETDRLDKLLQKIHDAGQATLTEEERAFLKEASERMKGRRSRD